MSFMSEAKQKESNMFSTKDLVDISDKLGIIQVVKSKLVNQPDKAASHLLAALEEILKIYLVFESEITKYLALTLEPDEIGEERATLLDLESGKIVARMGAARGHCGKIFNIYDRYLRAWLKRILDPDENAMMEQLFNQMSLTDSIMLDVIDEVSNWLATEAEETLNLIDAGDVQAAQQRIRAARITVTPARRAIAGAMRKIRDIEADFIEASKAV